ncbi:MAG: hypothetical protein ABJN34_15410 [Litoreibacter sp.]|uniref:hypothetical protein n=1 Tax=Litoreibacter sp. TaxID=1969459 RepID=UPI00329A1EB3
MNTQAFRNLASEASDDVQMCMENILSGHTSHVPPDCNAAPLVFSWSEGINLSDWV